MLPLGGLDLPLGGRDRDLGQPPLHECLLANSLTRVARTSLNLTLFSWQGRWDWFGTAFGIFMAIWLILCCMLVTMGTTVGPILRGVLGPILGLKENEQDDDSDVVEIGDPHEHPMSEPNPRLLAPWPSPTASWKLCSIAFYLTDINLPNPDLSWSTPPK